MTPVQLKNLARSHPITAIVYADGPQFESFLEATARALVREGLQLAGLIQRSRQNASRRKCDIFLEDLATGEIYGVTDDRGPYARGCMLNMDRLLSAGETAGRALSCETDLLVLSKFGKTEVSGGGFRNLIAAAFDLYVPLLIGVPEANLESFREFTGGLACEIDLADFDKPPNAAGHAEMT